MTKNENTGVVNCDEDKCVGCWSCIMVCPYGVIKRDISAKRVASKCDMCIDEKIPVCVKNCPNEALKFSDVETDNASDSNADLRKGFQPGNNRSVINGADSYNGSGVKIQ